MEGTTCQWISNCPYYEQLTSYENELVKCKNTDCPLYVLYKEEDEDD